MEASEPVWNSQRARAAQRWVGRGCWLATGVPFVRRVRGLDALDRQRRYLFVSNHVSLLDAITIGGLFTCARLSPVLILADRGVWDASGIRRLLSNRFGYVIERGKLDLQRVRQLQTFGRAIEHYNLLVFPEGTRGDGVTVAECQPGIHYIAQAAAAPIVPIFIEGMQRVSTKTGKFHPIAGFKKVQLHFGHVIPPENYLSLPREEFTQFIRQRILETRPVSTAALGNR